jgi:hypothetical protein
VSTVSSADNPGDMVDIGAVDDIPWPTAPETLLGSGDGWQAIACVDWARGDAVVRALGFERAAEVMYESIAQAATRTSSSTRLPSAGATTWNSS